MKLEVNRSWCHSWFFLPSLTAASFQKKKKAVEKVTSHSLGDAAASCVSSPQLPKEKEPQLGRTQPLMQRPPVTMDFR